VPPLVPVPLVPLPAPVAPVPAPAPLVVSELLLPGGVLAPLVPDGVVVPGPDVVPVPDAPMPLVPGVPLRLWVVVSVVVELGLVTVPPGEVVVVLVRVVDWHPAASTAARVTVSKAAGRGMVLKGMEGPRKKREGAPLDAGNCRSRRCNGWL
jgi:hypothetical protein